MLVFVRVHAHTHTNTNTNIQNEREREKNSHTKKTVVANRYVLIKKVIDGIFCLNVMLLFESDQQVS